MPQKYLIGVDLGTSATKAALYQINGELIAQVAVEVPLHHPKPGVVEQDNEDFYASAAQTVRECMRRSGVEPASVAAIAFNSQMAGVGLIDEAYRPVARFNSWLDMRCQPYIEAMEKDAGDRITQLTGCPPTCDHGPKMLWWKHEQPETYKRTAKFVMPGAYVAGKLAGLMADQAFIDHTYIHFSGFSDARNGTWSAELCERFGLDAAETAKDRGPNRGRRPRAGRTRGRIWFGARYDHRGRGGRYSRQRAGCRHRTFRDAFRCGRHGIRACRMY